MGSATVLSSEFWWFLTSTDTRVTTPRAGCEFELLLFGHCCLSMVCAVCFEGAAPALDKAMGSSVVLGEPCLAPDGVIH